jgi:hypothetical protein
MKNLLLVIIILFLLSCQPLKCSNNKALQEVKTFQPVNKDFKDTIYNDTLDVRDVHNIMRGQDYEWDFNNAVYLAAYYFSGTYSNMYLEQYSFYGNRWNLNEKINCRTYSDPDIIIDESKNIIRIKQTYYTYDVKNRLIMRVSEDKLDQKNDTIIYTYDDKNDFVVKMEKNDREDFIVKRITEFKNNRIFSVTIFFENLSPSFYYYYNDKGYVSEVKRDNKTYCTMEYVFNDQGDWTELVLYSGHESINGKEPKLKYIRTFVNLNN